VALEDLRAPAGFTLAASASESARFGRDIARLVVTATAPAELTGLDTALDGCPADVVVARWPSAALWLPALLCRPGRDVVAAGAIVYWGVPVGSGRRPAADTALTVDVVPAGDPAAAEVAPLVDALVADSFAGYGNHYSADPLLARSAAEAGYQEWARRSLTDGGHAVVVLRAGGEALGIATVSESADTEHVEILLAGIASAAQGRRLYGHLLAGVEDLAAALGATRVVISTQTHNTRVQRAWARYGMEPFEAYETAHLVRRGLLPA
jgi:RimJ/RimL family protein N-acetyltransferase